MSYFQKGLELKDRGGVVGTKRCSVTCYLWDWERGGGRTEGPSCYLRDLGRGAGWTEGLCR